MKIRSLFSRETHISEFPALLDFLMESDLHLLDIGGRGGPVNELKGLERVAKLTIVEPDPIESDRLASDREIAESWREIKIIQEAISKIKGEVNLNVTKQIGLSSIYEINEDVVRAYFCDDSWAVEKTIAVQVDTLQNIEKRYSLKAVDVIKIDTQGSELEILKSASDELIKGVSAIMIEIEMQQFYKSQPVFPEVDMWLRENGFLMYDLARAKLRRANSSQLEFSKREIVWAHCLYFRQPALSCDLRKLASTLICFGYLDSALQVIEKINSESPIDLYHELKRDLTKYSRSLLSERGFLFLSKKRAHLNFQYQDKWFGV